jgi:hypothetical protein
VIEQTLQANSPGAANLDKTALHIGAVAFIHRLGSSLNAHVHFHVCAVDGVFEVVAGEGCADAQARAQARAPGHDKRGTQVDEITLTPLELMDRIAALLPPPRTHRHRYFGVLAPHSPLRAAVVALAAGQTADAGTAQHEPVGVPATVDVSVNAMGVATVGAPSQPEPAQPARPKSQAHEL